MVTELLAQVIEEVSIVATANVQRNEPRTVPRPDYVERSRRGITQQMPEDPRGENVVDFDGYRKAISVLASTRHEG